jgi:RNA polymerase sigma factor (sigma-70 family)
MPSPDESFLDLVQRLRAGDATAASELVRRYEPEIRRGVRVRLCNPLLQPVLDSMDICQSVLGDFLARVRAGQFELRSPEDLTALLVTMARNKLKDHLRRQRAGRRDRRRQVGGEEVLARLTRADESPGQAVVREELLWRLREQLTPEEKRLADLRDRERTWAEIAEEVGAPPDTLRRRLERALARAARLIGLQGADGT